MRTGLDFISNLQQWLMLVRGFYVAVVGGGGPGSPANLKCFKSIIEND